MDNRIAELLQDTMIHKELVLSSCWKIANYFLAKGETQKAIDIIKRGWVHDLSKLTREELDGLSKIDDNHASMRHAGMQLPEHMKEYLALHYQHNTHHPEHWHDVSEMPEMDVVEMCCDWRARSLQYGTDLLEFAKTRQENRFHFPPNMFQKIMEICEVLVS